MNIESAVARLQSGRGLSTAEMMLLGRSAEAVPALVQALRNSPAEVRMRGLGLLVDLGRPMVPQQGRIPERPGAIVESPAVVAYLIEALADDDAEVRRKAGMALAGLVPGDLLRAEVRTLITRFERYPLTDGGLIVLGKTDSPHALAFINSHPEMHSSAADVEMVRARLGDHQAEDAVLAAYIATNPPRDKGLQARRLGFVGTDRAVRLLARDIRTPVTYAWIDAAQRSLRVHIIEGLHLAYMRESVFWPPMVQPNDDSYYQQIEEWLTARLGTRWDNPRPPFLYQQSAPMTPPMQAR